MDSTLTDKDFADLRDGLRRCSPETVEAAIRYRQHGDLQDIPGIVYGIIERYQSATATIKLSKASPDTRLMEDLGLDSLTLLEIVLSIEEVLKVRVENEELKSIRTLGQMNQFLQAKITGAVPAPAGKPYSREQIALILPQQPPFMFLDAAEINDGVVQASYAIRGDEYFLEGHFKDDPVFPASIVFEALGQAACLWVLEQSPKQLGQPSTSQQVVFASLDGARFFRKTKPGERLDMEVKLRQLRAPLAIFEGTVSVNGQRVARIEKLMLAFGDLAAATAEQAQAAGQNNGADHPAPVASTATT